MRRPAWTSGLAAWAHRPWVRIGLVVLIGTCFWATTGRREPAAVRPVGETSPDPEVNSRERAAMLLPRIAEVSRRLPVRQFRDTDRAPAGAIQAEYVMRSTDEQGVIQPAGFTAEVRANSPVWLTGAIEVDE